MSKYFDELEFLYQKISLQEADEQLEIAETGADVNEPGLDSETPPPEEEQGVNNAAEQDAAYMNDGEQEYPEEPSDVAVDEISRNRKLFSLYNELLTYGTYFLENISNVSLDMLNDEQVKKVLVDISDMKQTIQKIKDYILLQYAKYPYQRNLYVYIVLRTELMTEVKIIREVLKDEEK